MTNQYISSDDWIEAKRMQVPYSAGRAIPSFPIPLNACDCHHHIYDPIHYPYALGDTRNQPPATVDAYQMLQKRLGLTRNVIIQPSAYGTNNDCTLSALKVMGDNARAIVVIKQTISDDELAEMNALGVRGIRFNIATGASNEPQNILRMAHKVHQFGWHVQFWMSAQDTVDLAPILQLLPNQIVFDHRGHLPQPEGINHPAYKIISSLLERGKAWVKLSGLYIDTNVSAPGYSDTVEVGKAFVDIAPERAVWGTDWPHPSIFSERRPWPDDAEMLSLLALQAPDQKVLHQILVENPEVLYGFSSTKNLKG